MSGQNSGKPGPRRFGLVVYIAILAAGATTIAILLDRNGAQQPARPSTAALPALGALLVAAEYLFVRFRYAGQVNGLNLFEAVLAPLLFFYSPEAAVGTVAIAQCAGAILRRNAPVKAAFNIAQWSLATAIGAAALSALARGDGLTGRSLVALLVVLAIVGVVNQAAFTIVLALANRERLSRVLRSMKPVIIPGWVAGWVLNTLFGVLFIFAFEANPASVVLFPVPLAVLHLAYRGYAGSRSDRMRLTGLHRAARVLAEPLDPHQAIPAFLEEVARSFDARGAELVLRSHGSLTTFEFDLDRTPPFARREEPEGASSLGALVLSGNRPVRFKRDARHVPQELSDTKWRDCLGAPLANGTEVAGALLVLDQGGLEGFEEGELAVIEVIARETASTFAKGDLLVAILEERRRLNDVVGATSDGIFTIDPFGVVTGWNPAMELVTGIDAAAVIGRPGALDPIDARDVNGLPARFDQWLEIGAPPSEIRITGAGGTRRLSCSFSTIRDADGVPMTMVVVARDVTPQDEIKELRQEFGRLAREQAAQRAVVEQLQEAVMPMRPTVPGVELAVAYSASDPTAPTGGDLYDWQVLPSGEVHLAVVDVLGHGVGATKDALSVIHVLRWLTLEGCPLEDLIGRANGVIGAQYPDLVATAMIARYDPARGRVRLAGGGHPPAILLSLLGGARQIPLLGGAIGWPGAGSEEVADIDMQPGDTLMIYTDGLVEATKDILEGTETLLRNAAELAREPVQRFADEVVQRSLAAGNRRDDSLALVLRRAASTRRASWHLPPDSERAHIVRQEFGSWLAAHKVPTELVGDLQLVASELLANAVVSARSSVAMRVSLEPHSVIVEVEDDGIGRAGLDKLGKDQPSVEVDAGRGLYIVRALTDDVSLLSTFEGTVIRCSKEIATPTQSEDHRAAEFSS